MKSMNEPARAIKSQALVAALKHDVQRSILARVDGRCEKNLSQIAHRQRKSTLAG
jgi:hypothetical protein